MTSIDVSAILAAVHAWVVAGSGLAAGRVLWEEQRQRKAIAIPDGPWISLRIRGVGRVGRDWIKNETNPAPTAGAEIVRRVQGLRQVALEIRMYGGDVGASVGVLDGVVTASVLPAVAAGLRAAKVGVGQASSATSADGYVGAAKVFEPRASLDVTLFVPSELVGTDTNIAHVTITSDDSTATVDAPALP